MYMYIYDMIYCSAVQCSAVYHIIDVYVYVHLRYEKPYASPTNDDSMKRYGLLLRCKVSKKLVL